MTEPDTIAEVRGQLVGIKQSIERILDHHDGFKDDIKDIGTKFEKVQNELHTEALHRTKGDAEVKEELHKTVVRLSVAIAIAAVSLVSNAVLWVLKDSL